MFIPKTKNLSQNLKRNISKRSGKFLKECRSSHVQRTNDSVVAIPLPQKTEDGTVLEQTLLNLFIKS
ncbi:hypothetical protein LEP1GSC056_3715 [Leptospira borgpetersenii str. Brem 328]|uniref:Uncharacterized protein n=1 Tax=Leptospira borgpetersenii str. Brem 328 TaxID=1049780 RepID=A0ABC9SDT0_LEPBO|nr:hypothetical protein LEP1GSC056_3715 [Leptospira borgpetersenii str. Brem 328]